MISWNESRTFEYPCEFIRLCLALPMYLIWTPHLQHHPSAICSTQVSYISPLRTFSEHHLFFLPTLPYCKPCRHVTSCARPIVPSVDLHFLTPPLFRTSPLALPQSYYYIPSVSVFLPYCSSGYHSSCFQGHAIRLPLHISLLQCAVPAIASVCCMFYCNAA